MFCEHLADADDAALMRLVIMYMLWRHPFGGLSFLSSIFPARKTAFFMDSDLKNNFPSTKQPLFVDETANSKIKSLNLEI